MSEEDWIVKLDLDHDLPATDFYSRMEKHLPQLEKNEIKIFKYLTIEDISFDERR